MFLLGAVGPTFGPHWMGFWNELVLALIVQLAFSHLANSHTPPRQKGVTPQVS